MDDKQKKTLLIVGVVVFILILGTLILVLLNRGSREQEGPTGTDMGDGITIEGQVELDYWGLWEPPSVVQPLIDEFEEQNPNIKINYSQQTFSNYESRLFTRLQQAAGATEPAPDIFRIHNTWTPKYYQYLSPVPAQVMTAEDYREKFYPTAVSDFTAKDGNIYAIPWYIDGLVVFYNKQILSEEGVQEPPSDWDGFFELAQSLTEKDASGRILQSGVAMGTSRNIRHSAEILAYLLLLEGVDVMDETRTRVTLNTPQVQRVFETYTDFARGSDAIWSSTLRTDLEMFFSGNLAMMIAPSWRAFDIIEAAPTIEFDTAPLPQLEANPEDVYYATYWGDAVSKTSTNPLAAWKFINFLAQKEQQMKLYSNASKIRAFGEPYSLVELNNEMLDKPYVSAIAQMAPNMKAMPWGDEVTVNNALDEAITSIIENRRDVSTALRDTENTINATIEQTNR
jgi:ABC-type glycerol-3-phosphate transport system substrate-binding protein